ncbi:hypothetical protein BKA82DRAFT_434289 [Pisolithus tinctorius]|uniref:Uncharacterized protein n=1 Tax=Pisolithus tinctorius Marx 270 TaxID=870435 RepID=A0A0C3PEC7_PISTI|nr:hypothetical protein BKA82DRAFT_434289 [Pisolithus tinctorius]KIO06561.1 hypothetical protein M404DRAFT_434289 [Pisolithus tinctorius Marx 270]
MNRPHQSFVHAFMASCPTPSSLRSYHDISQLCLQHARTNPAPWFEWTPVVPIGLTSPLECLIKRAQALFPRIHSSEEEVSQLKCIRDKDRVRRTFVEARRGLMSKVKMVTVF